MNITDTPKIKAAPEMSVIDQANNAIIWIENLPYHEQCKTGDLEHEGKFCCLGVLNHLLGLKQNYHYLKVSVGLNGSLGETNNLEFVGLVSLHEELAAINDNLEEDFEDIADILAAHPENFFTPLVAELVRAHFEQELEDI